MACLILYRDMCNPYWPFVLTFHFTVHFLLFLSVKRFLFSSAHELSGWKVYKKKEKRTGNSALYTFQLSILFSMVVKQFLKIWI